MTRRTFGTAAAAVTLLAAGCGGGDRLSQDEYQQELDDATGKVEQAFADLSQSAGQVSKGSGSLDELAGDVGDIQDELNAAADDLDDAAPPEDVESSHDKLVDGMRQLSDDLDEFRKAIEDGDAGAIEDFAAGAANMKSTKTLEAASNELEKQGYEVGTEE
jgi:uncharacterized phage infection (PIP) family protein YhgE